MAEHIESLKLKVDSTEVQKGKKSLDDLTASGVKAEGAAIKTSKSFISLGTAMAGSAVAAAALLVPFVKLSDQMTAIESKLKLVTKTTNQLATAQKELFDIAQRTRQGYAETADTFA